MAKILVVDDERDITTLIKFLLEKDGHEVTEAFNGKEALEILGVEPRADGMVPDIMVLDVMMPLVDGYTVAQKVSESDRHKAMPIIVLSAKGQMKELFQMAENVASFLDKPFDPKMLKSMIDSVLKK
jgi:DNA-binding response OmpR family regulator